MAMSNDYLTVLEAIERTVERYGAYHSTGEWSSTGVKNVLIFNAHNKGKGLQRKNAICFGTLGLDGDGNITFEQQRIVKHTLGSTGRRKIYYDSPDITEISDWKVTKYLVDRYTKDTLIIYAEPVATQADLNDGLEDLEEEY